MKYGNLVALGGLLIILALLTRIAAVWRLQRTAKRIAGYLEANKAVRPVYV